MKHYLSLSALTLAAALTLSACGSTTGSDIADTPAPASSAAADSPSTAESPTSTSHVSDEHNEADVMFAQMMIPHHEQAVEMTEMMLAKDGISPEVLRLAMTIRDAQGPEIDTMTGWLDAWDEPLEPEHGMMGHDMESGSESMEGMGGMMSKDQMSELQEAEGEEASRLFLESMTVHHEGAVVMARDQIDNGENSEAIQLAENIVETQQAEIRKMTALLTDL